MNNANKWLLALLGSLLLILGACAPAMDDDMSDMAEGDTMMEGDMAEGEMMDGEMMEGEMAEGEMMDSEMEAEEMGPNIVEVAQEAGSFSTLITALQIAGLDETLMGEGPFTVFAPTDEAFAAALDALGMTADELLVSPDLSSILLYHVVPGEVLAETVVTLDSATTVQGDDVAIAVVDGGVVLNDSVNVTTTDIGASNGVIHVIDGVLLPPM